MSVNSTDITLLLEAITVLNAALNVTSGSAPPALLAAVPAQQRDYVQLAFTIVSMLAVFGAWIYSHFGFKWLQGKSCPSCVSAEKPAPIDVESKSPADTTASAGLK